MSVRIVNLFSGFGDSQYQRIYIRALGEMYQEVYLKTPLPDFYSDLKNIKFIKPLADYRTQTKHMNTVPSSVWSKPPVKIHPSWNLTLGYNGNDLAVGSIFQAFEKKVPLGTTPFKFDLPTWTNDVHEYPETKIKNKGKPIAIIRPVTIRKEWVAEARAPRPEYIAELAEILISGGYHVVSIADTAPNQEWMLQPEPNAHQKFHGGELTLREILALTKKADIIVAGVGLFLPIGIASGTPTFIVFGGQGGYNQIPKLVDPRMDLTKFGYVLPENFCRCVDGKHECNKLIKNLPEKFYDFMMQIQRIVV